MTSQNDKLDEGCRERQSSRLRFSEFLGGGCGDDAAGDAIACVSGGVGLHVVGLFVDDDGGASVGDDAVGGGGVKGEIVNFEGGLAEVTFADSDVLRKVAGVVAHGILKAVLFVLGIEVWAGGLEVRGVAQGLGVDVDGMLADGKILEVELDDEPALCLLKGGGACVLAGAGFERNDNFIFWLFSEGWDGEQTEGECGDRVAHRMDLQSTSSLRIQKYLAGLREEAGFVGKISS